MTAGALRTACVAAVLAACAPASPPPTPASPMLAGPGVPLALPLSEQPARDLLEEVAARCWLDHVVRGGSMVVDRRTGRVIITSDTADLLVADLVPAGDGTSLVRLTGPAADDPSTARRLSETLEAAVTTGRTACPPA